MKIIDLLFAAHPILALALAAGWYYPAYLLFMIVPIGTTRLYYQKRFQMIYPELV